jgi:GDP-L-fucose synthase
MMGFTGRITRDATQPNRQPRRCLDVIRAERAFGFRGKMSFEERLRETTEWHLPRTRVK